MTKPHVKDRVKSVSLQKHADARQQNQVNHQRQVIPGREKTIVDVINGDLEHAVENKRDVKPHADIAELWQAGRLAGSRPRLISPSSRVRLSDVNLTA